jgi:glc operon protein GlcG
MLAYCRTGLSLCVAACLLSLPGAVPIEGGIPLMADDKLLGSIGVSGVTAPQDGQIAQAGVAALPKLLGK